MFCEPETSLRNLEQPSPHSCHGSYHGSYHGSCHGFYEAHNTQLFHSSYDIGQILPNLLESGFTRQRLSMRLADSAFKRSFRPAWDNVSLVSARGE